jgi:ABC-type branched-subunit amino acid transport system substrate-binding protein
MGRAIKQARELGIHLQFLSISTLNDAEVIKVTGDKATGGE